MRRVCASPSLRTAIALLALWGATAAAHVVLAAGDPGRYRILAGPYSRKEVKAGRGQPEALYTLKGLTVRVRHIESRERAAFVTALDRTLRDPFAVPPGRPEMYTTFKLTFENGAGADVLFQAGNVVLITDRKTQEFPVDLTDLYRLAAEVGAADPERTIDRVARVLYDSSTTIPKGRTMERLLVFGPLPPKWKELQLHFSFLQIGTETHTLVFTFHRQPLQG